MPFVFICGSLSYKIGRKWLMLAACQVIVYLMVYQIYAPRRGGDRPFLLRVVPPKLLRLVLLEVRLHQRSRLR